MEPIGFFFLFCMLLIYLLFGLIVAGQLDLELSHRGRLARCLVIIGYIFWPITMLIWFVAAIFEYIFTERR